MSIKKAEQFLDLVALVSARRIGVTLEDVVEKFNVSYRTAQRMMYGLEDRFPETETYSDEEGHKRWRMPGGTVRDLISISADELAAIDLGIAHLKRAGSVVEAQSLESLRGKVISMIPNQRFARLEPDHDALLEAQGFVARSGPRPRINEDIARTVAEAIKACRYIEISHRSANEKKARTRKVAPYGLLSGLRRYLVVLDPADTKKKSAIKTFRMDLIEDASLTNEFFERPSDFDLQTYANRAFGLYQKDDEYGPVIWKFKPEAAERARDFLFHPEQREEPLPDGSLLISFEASGYLEMAWHLYTWGDKVEVIEPKGLRDLVNGYQRKDFNSLP
jgi:predicted DNA-binding transcriptional regulator YafY